MATQSFMPVLAILPLQPLSFVPSLTWMTGTLSAWSYEQTKPLIRRVPRQYLFSPFRRVTCSSLWYNRPIAAPLRVIGSGWYWRSQRAQTTQSFIERFFVVLQPSWLTFARVFSRWSLEMQNWRNSLYFLSAWKVRTISEWSVQMYIYRRCYIALKMFAIRSCIIFNAIQLIFSARLGCDALSPWLVMIYDIIVVGTNYIKVECIGWEQEKPYYGNFQKWAGWNQERKCVW